MKCPFCGFAESKVIDSRPAEEGATIRRRRECLACQKRFTTYEIIETLPLVVIKRDGSRQSFDKSMLTSGGTGFSMRDQTPEATMAVADRNAPGIAEAIRYKSMAVTDRAMLSRGVSVIRKKTLIVNLPGSPKAVKESLGFILDSLDHGLKILRGSASECARRD